MDKIEVILNSLLNKYERSKSFQGDSNRRILLKMKDVKEYNIENYEEKEQFHDRIKELKQKGIIEGFSWEPFEKGNILKEVWLNKENVERAYEEIGRSNKKQEAEEIIKQLQACEFKIDWLQQYKQDMLAYCKEKQKVPNLLPYAYSEKILKALKNLTPEQEVLKRVFSIKCYGDSKYFENVIESYLIRILKKYLLVEQIPSLTDEELLLQVGITKAPEIIEFCGNLQGVLNGQEINYTIQTKGCYMNSYTIKQIENLRLEKVNTVLWIENKTNYIDYISHHQKPEELVIYHGGMYSPTKGTFFKKVYQAIDNHTKCYHWSDIDIGGFKIFTRLKEEIVKNLSPIHMERQDLEKMQSYWKPISKPYQTELEKMYQMEQYTIFKDTIAFMIKHRCKLEQESFII